MSIINPFAGVQHPMQLDAAGVASGQAFLVGELEKRDPRLIEPLTSVTWQRDITADTGGGWVDFTSLYNINYATAGSNEDGIINGQTNVLPTMQINIEKGVFATQIWNTIARLSYIDMMRYQQIGRSVDQMIDDGIRLAYNKALDKNTYQGFTSVGQTGLVNDPNVTATLAAADGTDDSRFWKDKTPSQILVEFNRQLVAAYKACNYDIEGIPNHVLLPPDVLSDLNTRIVSEAGNVSILTYLEQNNWAKTKGRSLFITDSRFCIGQGLPVETGGDASDRAVFYVNEQDKVSFDLTVPLMRTYTQPDAQQFAYLTPYVAQIGVVKFKYYQCVRYLDGVSQSTDEV